MKVGIIIPCYNRPEYLKQCLSSIANADLSQVAEIMLIDDNSTNKETIQLIADFVPSTKVTKHKNFTNEKISKCLLTGYNYFFIEHNFDIVINFDSDALIRKDCIPQLLKLHQPGKLLTGFHSTTMGRHTILSEHDGYVIKESVGGINFCIDRQTYINHVKPSLEVTVNGGNFDHLSSISSQGVMCAVPSLVQHIGINSSLGHHDNPDVADTFLHNVTLFGVDSNVERLKIARDTCTKHLSFADVVLLHPNITSKEQYSSYILKECYKHIQTSHVLIFQHDGFVNNAKAWDNSWLEYDYIGAPWWYKDGHDVGNGGFSLRSKRLMEVLATDPIITELHPEDHIICRIYRTYLENTYGIKFAPLSIAERFAFEGYMQPGKYLSDQFGVHGNNPRRVPKTNSGDRFVINQFRGLGDILFLVPLIRFLQDEGHSVLWPIAKEFFNIAKHFPDINFVVKEDCTDIPFENAHVTVTPYGKLLPYRFAGSGMHDCMRAKYDLYSKPLEIWRNLYWKRYVDKEAELATLLNLPEKYILVNNNFCQPELGIKMDIMVDGELPIIQMRIIDGFSMLDWTGVIMGASEIHTANTSIIYMLEVMELDMPIHLYRRGIHHEKAFEHTQYLYTKPYILH